MRARREFCAAAFSNHSRRLDVVGFGAETFQINFADIILRIGIAGVGLAQPHFQRGLVVGAIVRNIFAAADFAVGLRGADRAARAHERGGAAELAHLTWQKAIDDEEVFGIARLHASLRNAVRGEKSGAASPVRMQPTAAKD